MLMESIAPGAVRALHNDTAEDAELVLVSVRIADTGDDAVKHEGFWPS